MKRNLLLLACVATLALACEESEIDPNRGNNLNNVNNTNNLNNTNNVIPTGAGVGEECDGETTVCRDGLACVESVCAFTGDTAEGAPCRLTGECAEGLFCDSLTSVCLQGGESEAGDGCGGTSDCLPGLVCAPRGFSGFCSERGTIDLGAACEDSSECYAGLNCAADPTNPEGGTVCLAGPIGLPIPWAGVECAEEEDDGPFRAYFELPEGDVTEFYRLPYPNDIRLDANGHPDLSGHPTPGPGIVGFDIVETYIDAAEASQDGFGLNSATYFRFSKPVNFDTVSVEDGTQNVFIFDIDPNSPDYGRRTSLRWAASSGGNQYICKNFALLRPLWGRPLAPDTTYAFVILNTVQDADGTPLGRDDDFAAMMGDTRPDGAAGEAWDKYAPLRDWLADDTQTDKPVAGNVAVASVVTTGNPWAQSQALATAARAEAATESELTLCDGQAVSPCDDGLQGDEHVRGCFDVSTAYHEIQGKLSLPIFQQGDAPYLMEGGMTTATVQRREDVCMAMTVPKATMPANGWPVIIYAHGTGGNARSGIGDIADLVSDIDVDGTPAQFVTIGWEQVQHDTRRNGSDIHPNELVFNYANPDAAMGNFLQGGADIHAITAWLENLQIPAANSPTGEDLNIDPAHIYFFGHSQGGTTGPLALPFDPTSRGGVLSGAGGGLTLALVGKTTPINSLTAVKVALQDSRADVNHPVLSILQAFFDPVDPINFAAPMGVAPVMGVTYPKNIFHTNGIGDTYTPPTGLNALAVALRATYIEPMPDPIARVPTGMAPFSGNVTHDTVQYTVAGRQYMPDGYDGHFVAFRDAQAQTDIANFFGTAYVNGTPEIR